MKKFKLTDEKIEYFGRTLYRIQALRDFSNVKSGDLGGFIEKEGNLSHDGYCWVDDDARVFGKARVYGNAKVCDDAMVYENARVFENAYVCENAKVYGNAWVYGNAGVKENAKVYGEAHVTGDATIQGNALLYDDAHYCVFQGFGSGFRATTFYIEENSGISVTSGCFTGNMEEFEKQVEETHGDNKFGREYKAIIEVVKIKYENKI